MKIAVICFTKRGMETAKRLEAGLLEAGHEARSWVLGRYAVQAASGDRDFSFEAVKEGGLSEWTGRQFQEKSQGGADALIFIGACGIAVRAIAPFVRDKRTDPAVVSIDEAGRFSIPLLSGHVGGANQLALEAAKILSAQPVVTTATDMEGRFAVDVFAKENGLFLEDWKGAKDVSAAVLAGEPVGFFSDFPVKGPLPRGLSRDTLCKRNLWITVSKRETDERMLRLIPRCVAVGIGCRRGTPEEKIREILEAAFAENRVDIRSVGILASIDLKSGEPGLCNLAASFKLPFFTYTAGELEAVPGAYTESAFVKKTAGVGNVCERAAMAACLAAAEEARILFPKYARDGVTVAAACFFPKLFEGEETS